MATPSANGCNGRTAVGRFAAGNKLGIGNPYAQRTAAIRGLLFDSVTDDDLRAIIATLVAMAIGGDLAAAREVLDRMIGKPKSTLEIERAALDEAELDTELNHVLEELASEHETSDSGASQDAA